METIKVIIDNLKDCLLFKIICTKFSSLELRNETITVNIFVNINNIKSLLFSHCGALYFVNCLYW